jgi:hypothetical protein
VSATCKHPINTDNSSIFSENKDTVAAPVTDVGFAMALANAHDSGMRHRHLLDAV